MRKTNDKTLKEAIDQMLQVYKIKKNMMKQVSLAPLAAAGGEVGCQPYQRIIYT